jgi:hypothetical protein
VNRRRLEQVAHERTHGSKRSQTGQSLRDTAKFHIFDHSRQWASCVDGASNWPINIEAVVTSKPRPEIFCAKVTPYAPTV